MKMSAGYDGTDRNGLPAGPPSGGALRGASCGRPDDRLIAALGFVAEPAAELPDLTSAPQIFEPLAGVGPAAIQDRRIALLNDVEMGVSVELGRARMTVRELLALGPGVIVELNRAAGAPVDLLVNGTLMARGEVVVVDEEFAIRISEIVTSELSERRGA